MVGNDVVDLDDPETGVEGLNPRFDQRVFGLEERRRLESSGNAHVLRWMLWAAKESAYKLAKRSDHETRFAHSLFRVDLDEDGFGVVRHRQWLCAVAVTRHGSAIHAIATSNDCGRARIVSGLGQVQEGDDPSVCVRELARTAVARHLSHEPARITITTGNDRIPVLRLDGDSSGFLSLSHHGAVSAFAWAPTF